MRKSVLAIVSLLVLVATLAACGPAPTPVVIEKVVTSAPVVQVQTVAVVQTVEVVGAAPTAVPTKDLGDVSKRTPVRWFVGLGAGTQPGQIEVQNKVVQAFNLSQDKIYLTIEIVPNAQAYQILQTEVAAGNAPDLVGPVGIRGVNGFQGLWLDIAPLIKSTNYDLSDFDPAQVEFYKMQGAQVGLPFGIYPSYLYYNKALFKEAGVAEPPHKFGDKYDGKDWNTATFKELAMKLTVDKNGVAAGESGFDSANIVQYGFNNQWTDLRGELTEIFGAGNFVKDDFKTAYIPDNWKEGIKWYYDGMWKDFFYPTDTAVNSDLLGKGNTFNSGHVAMAATHLWYTCCIDKGDKAAVKDWDIAVVPAYNGKYTAKFHVDTFRIFNTTKDPAAAFAVLQYLLSPEVAPQLLNLYGSFPARKSLQTKALADLDAKFAPVKIDWQVMLDSAAYPDIPSHEADMPNFLKAEDRYKNFRSKLGSTAGLDVEAEMTTFVTDEQTIFDQAATK